MQTERAGTHINTTQTHTTSLLAQGIIPFSNGLKRSADHKRTSWNNETMYEYLRHSALAVHAAYRLPQLCRFVR